MVRFYSNAMARIWHSTITAIAALLCLSAESGAEQFCTRVVGIDTCTSTVYVESTSMLSVQDTIIVYQSQGAITNSDGDLIGLGHAGEWSIHTVAMISQHTIVLRPNVPYYDTEGSVQVCRVLGGSVVRITSNLNVLPFADGVGGICSIVADTVELGAIIDAAGRGFRGGWGSLNSYDTCVQETSNTWLSGIGGGKGVGLSTEDERFNAGRGNRDIGGGGGNARNAGGGGGGSVAGRGGNGGFQTSEFGSLPLGGHGGTSVLFHSTHRVFLGGGGGGGHQNDHLGTAGGAGGGVVLIIAKVIKWLENGRILVSGSGAETAIADGAGGGGGGGTIWILCDSVVIPKPLHRPFQLGLQGGAGGRTFSEYRRYGPGGGGAGGVAILSASVRSTPLTANVEGGVAGRVYTADSSNGVDGYGAEAGANGIVLGDASIPEYAIQPCSDTVILLRVLDTAAPAGSTVSILIEVELTSPLPVGVSLRIRIRARATSLWPLGPFWWSGRRYTKRYAQITLSPTTERTSVYYIPYQCLLGDSAEVGVVIDSVDVDPPGFRATVLRNGRFQTSDVCYATGSARLFDQTYRPGYPAINDYEAGDPEFMIDLLGRIWRKSDLHSSASAYHQRYFRVLKP